MLDNSFHTVKGYESINKKLITPSMEDYLEMIYRCSEEENFMRLNKLAQMLNVRDSSASKMVKKLGDLNLVKYERYGVIVLTSQGKKVGRYLLERHNIVEKFLQFICGTDEVLKETELIEHVISSDTVEKIYMFNNFIKKNKDIKEKFNRYRSDFKNKVTIR